MRPSLNLLLYEFFLLNRSQSLLQNICGGFFEFPLAGAAKVMRRLEQRNECRSLLRECGVVAEIFLRQFLEAEFVLGGEFPSQI